MAPPLLSSRASSPLTCSVGWPGQHPSSPLYPKQMRCANQRVTFFTLPLLRLCHYQSRGTPGPTVAPDLIRTIILMTKQGPAYLLLSESSTILTRNLLAVGASKLAQQTSIYKGLGDRGVSGGDTDSRIRLDLRKKIGLDNTCYETCSLRILLISLDLN